MERFLNELENDQQIEQHKSFVSTVLTITNYEHYQKRGTAERAADEQQTGSRRAADDTADGQQNGALYKKNTKKNKEEEEVKRTRAFVKPTIEEVRAYCTERNKGVNAETWFDHYQSNGWKVGKNAMKDWRAAVRKWENSLFDNGNRTPQTAETWAERKKREQQHGNA